MDSTSQGKWLAIIALLIVVLGVGCWVMKSDSDTNANPDWQTYSTADFNLQYPSSYRYSPGDSSGYPIGSALVTEEGQQGIVPVIATLQLDKTDYANTNLAAAWLTLSKTDDTYFESCQTAWDGSVYTLMQPSEVNDITWDERSGSWEAGAAAGTKFETRTFHTLHDGTCYEVALHLATSNIGNYEPGSVTAVDEDALKAQLLDIFHTFTFTK